MRSLAVLCVLAVVLHAEEFDSDGVRVHYVEGGKGEAVILIHGFGGNARSNWQLPGTFALLEKDYHVVALDCRGHGDSAEPEGKDAYGAKMVEDVVRLMDHLEIKQAHIVGYSMGGILAVNLVVHHPDRVLSVVLGGMGWLKADGLLSKAFEAMPGRGGLGPEGCMSSLGSLSVTEEEVKKIAVPLSMIAGERDPCRRMYVEPLHDLRPEFDVLVVEGAGHITCIAKPEFKEGVKAALDRHVAAKKK